ncbi:hypothetical protein T09_3480 [Trichinella sp. T9]|nr:hypothetical protein T09_3480 [Trichinella sp. T9]
MRNILFGGHWTLQIIILAEAVNHLAIQYFVYFLFCFWNPRFFRLFEYCTDFRDEEIESVPLNWTAKLAGCLATWNTGRCSDTDPRQSRGRIEIEWKYQVDAQLLSDRFCIRPARFAWIPFPSFPDTSIVVINCFRGELVANSKSWPKSHGDILFQFLSV